MSIILLLKKIWRRWLPIAKAIGNFQSQLILSLFYLVIFMPLGIFFRIFADPYAAKKRSRSNFIKWEHPKENLEEARRQY